MHMHAGPCPTLQGWGNRSGSPDGRRREGGSKGFPSNEIPDRRLGRENQWEGEWGIPTLYVRRAINCHGKRKYMQCMTWPGFVNVNLYSVVLHGASNVLAAPSTVATDASLKTHLLQQCSEPLVSACSPSQTFKQYFWEKNRQTNSQLYHSYHLY